MKTEIQLLKINEKIESMGFYYRLIFILINKIFNKKDFRLAEQMLFNENQLDWTDDLNTTFGQLVYNLLILKK